MANQMPAVIKQTVEKAVKLLDATGSSYKVITADGTEYGKLEVVPPRKRKINTDREYGAIRKYYDRFVKYDAQIGDVFEIPVSQGFTAEEIRGGVCAKLTGHWGKGTYTTAIVEDRVQILRTA